MSRPAILVLGSSSGFGAAICRRFADSGYDIFGVHLDRRSTMGRVDELVSELRSKGGAVHFYNVNAADDDARKQTIDDIAQVLTPGQKIDVLVHSLAFGTLIELVRPDGTGVRRKQLDMTVHVMAHSLVYWCQELVAQNLLHDSRVFAMTSSGSTSVWETYGPVSAAKSTLEAHIRQLALELAPLRVTTNAILAGVTDTPALAKIPHSDSLMAKAISKNPHNRLTKPEDVAACLIELSRPGTYWMTGNVIHVDGGEDVCA